MSLTNELYTTPTALTGNSGSVATTFVGATGSSLHYSLTPTVSGMITLTVTYTTPNLVNWIELYRGSDTTPLIYVDDMGSDVPSTLTRYVQYPVSAGIKQHIKVLWTSSTTKSPFTLSWAITEAAVDSTSGFAAVAMTTDYKGTGGMCFNASLGQIWLQLNNEAPNNRIAKINPANGAVLGYITHTEALDWPLFYDGATGYVWSGNSAFNALIAFDAATGAFVRKITSLHPSDWSQVDQSTGKLLDFNNNTIKVYTPSTGGLDTTLTISGSSVIWRPVTVGSGHMYAFTGYNYPNPAMLAKYNVSTGALLATFDIDVTGGHLTTDSGYTGPPDARYMQNMVLDPDRYSLWILREGAGAASPRTKLVEFSLVTDTVVATYTVPDYQHWTNNKTLMAYDADREAIVLVSRDAPNMMVAMQTADGAVLQRQLIIPADTSYDYPYYLTPVVDAVFMGGGNGGYYRIGSVHPVEFNSFLHTIDDTDTDTVTGLPGYVAMGIAFNEAANEIWALTYDYPNTIQRIDPVTGESLGYITTTADLWGPMVYDPFFGVTWVASSSGFYGFDETGAQLYHFGSYSITWAVSPYDGRLWEARGGAEPGSTSGILRKWNTNGTYTDYPTFQPAAIQVIPTDTSDETQPAVYLIGNAGTGQWQIYKFRQVTQDSARMGLFTGTYFGAAVYDATRRSIWISTGDGTTDRIGEWHLANSNFNRYITAPYVNTVDGMLPMVLDPTFDVLWIADENTGDFIGYNLHDGSVYRDVFVENWDIAQMVMQGSTLWAVDQGSSNVYRLANVPPPPIELPTAINDRDVWLETFDPRFTEVTVQYGTTLNNAQTTGVTTALEAAKRLTLAASIQYFIVRP